jgi:site-specific DNA-methyltransferase (adenine-specific)
LYICGFSEILADLKLPALRLFAGCRWIIWHYKNKANLGSDWGRAHESILHFRKSKEFTFNIDDIRVSYGNHTLKYPEHPQAETSQYGNKGKEYLWQPHPNGAKPKDVIEVPTTCNGMNEKTPHPTQKPEELVRKFVLASSNPGDIVIDPFPGDDRTVLKVRSAPTSAEYRDRDRAPWETAGGGEEQEASCPLTSRSRIFRRRGSPSAAAFLASVISFVSMPRV